MATLLKSSPLLRCGSLYSLRCNATVASDSTNFQVVQSKNQLSPEEWTALLPNSPKTTKPFPRIRALDGFKNRYGLFKYHRWILQTAGINLYLSASDRVPVVNFLEHLQLPDTIDSWFNIVALHVWMIMSRCNELGMTGTYTGRKVAKAMWEDFDKRLSILRFSGREPRNEASIQTGQGFFALLYGLDEGVLTSDRVLAAALWRHIFTFRDVDFLVLETLVHYVRVQLKYLQEYDGDYLVSKGNIVWKPFHPLVRQGELLSRPISLKWSE